MFQQKGASSLLLAGAIVALPVLGISANEIGNLDTTQLQQGKTSLQPKSKSGNYIIQLKSPSGISVANDLGQLIPSNKAAIPQNRYNARDSEVQQYTAKLEQLHQTLAQKVGVSEITYSYTHTFNGFSATLTSSQVDALKANPDVLGVWEDQLQQVTTANTPTFLGLDSPSGQHTLDLKGEDVVVGIVDTGIWPENPSFADDGSYSDPTDFGWAGSCDAGEDEAFVCNHKLIGAQFFSGAFEATYPLIPQEFRSPRDADGHGSHTAGTAAGNENVPAVLFGTDVGSVTGIAPRARVAVYKACWNSDYETESGQKQSGCFYGDTMAAIDQAVEDGVDVINYSIGGSLTDLTVPSTAAMLMAERAGVFVAVSAGNDGPDISTVGTPAPWVMSVAASTYDGTSATNAISVVTDDDMVSLYESVEGAITKPMSEVGVTTQALVAAQPIDGCFIAPETPTPLENEEEIAGKIALITRGACAFTEKVERALLAGAVGVVVYTNNDGAPIVMGGTKNFDIPGVMISKANGETLLSGLDDNAYTAVTLDAGTYIPRQEVGNIIADFSSRGPNLSTGDVIKPDITAPGVRILAATTSNPAFAADGETFKYLQGTSMSAPHIAGMAALLKGQYPNWSPSIIKSALMTSARQNLVKETLIEIADPFDFGSGHAVPVSAMDPGLVYQTGFFDYMAFMCGLEQDSFVLETSGFACPDYVAANFDIDPSELNLPSIAIGELSAPEAVYRTVTNITQQDSVYTALVDAPSGISIEVFTASETGELVVNSGSSAQYGLLFTVEDNAQLGEWVFGSITWSDAAGHVVRSPIAVKVVSPQTILAPALVSNTVNATRGRLNFEIEMNYTGTTSQRSTGLTLPFVTSATIPQDADSTFTFNEASLGKHGFLVSEGTKALKFMLSDDLVSVPGADLDLYVYRCIANACDLAGQSTTATSNEEVLLINPEPAADGPNGDFYFIMVHAYNIDGQADSTVTYQMPFWFAEEGADTSNMRVSSSRRAIQGRSNYVSISTRGLVAGGSYLGAVSFLDNKGVEQMVTIVDVKAN
ncbi:S8 family serine peptidase [Echinimonas agarilytica]|uniref:S8 family serine peptidase n=1 Tax=Echinimonas agarilytica TaxID=1215918 RepID=A0AA41W7G1_9GAMM|nr:S8 family serine peptidase [Echinimonas agarilytica]MCM2680622.1 S8 family serine peptidase [Echinimonas agarilytica]